MSVNLATFLFYFPSGVRRKETNKQDCFILNIKLELPACIVYLCVPVEFFAEYYNVTVRLTFLI